MYIYSMYVYYIWLVLSDEQMSKGLPFFLLNDEQMSNWLGVEHQPDICFYIYIYIQYVYVSTVCIDKLCIFTLFIRKNPGVCATIAHFIRRAPVHIVHSI